MRSAYIAGRYSRREELKQYAEQLRANGIKVTSRWLDETLDPNVQLKELTPEAMKQIALIDMEDIDRADSFIFFSEDQNKQPPRGGRHVEFGYALATDTDLYVIGEEENLFHYVGWVHVFPTWDAFMSRICAAPVLV